MAMRIETGTESAVIFTEFQKPGFSPLQSRPVQAVSQALSQGSKVSSRRPVEEVAEADLRHALERGDDHHPQRQEEEDGREDQEGVDADPADGEGLGFRPARAGGRDGGWSDAGGEGFGGHAAFLARRPAFQRNRYCSPIRNMTGSSIMVAAAMPCPTFTRSVMCWMT